MSAKKPNGPPKTSGQMYIVSPRSGPAGKGDVTFRSSSSGQFNTRIMSNDAFRSASGKANTVIKEALRSPPTVRPPK